MKINLTNLTVFSFSIYIVGFLVGFRSDVFPCIVLLIIFLILFYINAWNIETDITGKIFSKFFIRLIYTLQTAGWFTGIFFKYYGYRLHVWDIGAFANPVSNLIHGYGFWNSFTRTPQFAEHFSPALLMFVPLFMIKETLLWLLLVKFIAYILSFFLLTRLCEEYKLEEESKRLVQFIWIMNPIVYDFMSNELQPSTFALPLIFEAFLLLKRGKLIPALICMLLTILFKESMVFAIMAFGLFLIIENKKYQAGLLLILFSVLAGYIILIWLPNTIYGMENIHRDEISLFNFPEKKLKLILRAFLLFLMIPLLRWKLIPVLIVTLGLSLFLSNESKITLGFHYADVPSVFFIVAVINVFSSHNLKSLLTKSRIHFIIFASVLTFFLSQTNRSSVHNVIYNLPSKETIDRVNATEKIKKQYQDSDKYIMSVGNVSAYLFSFNKISFIEHNSDIGLKKNTVYILDSIPSWPLTPELNKLLIDGMNENIKKDLVVQKIEFLPLLLYETKSR